MLSTILKLLALGANLLIISCLFILLLPSITSIFKSTIFSFNLLYIYLAVSLYCVNSSIFLFLSSEFNKFTKVSILLSLEDVLSNIESILLNIS